MLWMGDSYNLLAAALLIFTRAHTYLRMKLKKFFLLFEDFRFSSYKMKNERFMKSIKKNLCL